MSWWSLLCPSSKFSCYLPRYNSIWCSTSKRNVHEGCHCSNRTGVKSDSGETVKLLWFPYELRTTSAQSHPIRNETLFCMAIDVAHYWWIASGASKKIVLLNESRRSAYGTSPYRDNIRMSPAEAAYTSKETLKGFESPSVLGYFTGCGKIPALSYRLRRKTHVCCNPCACTPCSPRLPFPPTFECDKFGGRT